MQVKRFILIQTARHLCHRHATAAHLYQALAAQETDQAHQALFLFLAANETQHVQLLHEQLHLLGLTWSAEVTSWLAQIWCKFLVQQGWAGAWLVWLEHLDSLALALITLLR